MNDEPLSIEALADACWQICDEAALGEHLEWAGVLRPVVLPKLTALLRQALTRRSDNTHPTERS